MIRYGPLILLLFSIGCSDGKTTAQRIAEDVKARGLDTPPPGAAPAPEISEFKPYKAPSGEFQISFPGEPRVVDHGPNEPDHLTGMEAYMVARLPRQYSVLCTHHADPLEPAAELERLIDLQVRRSLGGKLTDSKDVTLKGKPAKQFVIADDEIARRGMLIVDSKDVYQVSVDLPKAEVDGEAARTFIDSFELLKE